MMEREIRININTDISSIKSGATVKERGVLFSIFSRNATRAWLLLFKIKDGEEPDYIFELTKETNRIGDHWYAFIEGLSAGWYYLWKMDGPLDPESGKIFNKDALLLDPYAKAFTGRIDSFPDEKNSDSQKFFNNPAKMAKGIVCLDDFNWEGDRQLRISLQDTIIYEVNLRGFTAGNTSKVKNPGTYSGLVEKIPYFKELGISAIELLPVNEFSIFRDNRKNQNSDEVLNNYWGYNTLGFFAPNGRYSVKNDSGEQVIEFKQMVKELHKAGIEIILDIVFNHTVEGGQLDKTLSFKGIDNDIYYMIDSKNGDYLEYTGCGNTLNCNHPVVSDFIIDCLHYWVLEMHVDGFRFDLASALNRDEKGKLLEYSPLMKRIEESPLLRDTKIIAEAWDAGGGYQVGGFKGRWAEWNGKYRDDVRKFWRGDPGSLGDFATRITGSSDLFNNERMPQQGINFIFSHDGYTMWDWASYNKKHNNDNDHDNEDGEDHNFSFNHGIEGETTDTKIIKLREKQAKNLIATLFLSLGTPMINGGDEFLRTQKGNNNAYCQDNEISWFDWNLLETNRHIFDFFKGMIEIRKILSAFFNRDFYKKDYSDNEEKKEIMWFGDDGNKLDWETDTLAFGVLLRTEDLQEIYIMFNSNNNMLFNIPAPYKPGKKRWKKIVDTDKYSPFDITPMGVELEHNGKSISVAEKSMIVLRLI